MKRFRTFALTGALLLAGCNDTTVEQANTDMTNPEGPPQATEDAGRYVAVTGHPDPLSLLASDDPVLARNKRLAFDFWRGVVNGGHVELADEMLAEGYIQHSPVLRTGRTAFKEIFSVVPRLDTVPELVSPPLVALVAEGDLVVMALAETVPAPDGSGTYMTTHFNLFRIEDGRLAEHWHSVQTAPGPDVPRPEDGGPQPVIGATGTEQNALLQATDATLAANKRVGFDAWLQIVDAGRDELAAGYLAENYIEHSAVTGSGFAPLMTRAERPMGSALAEPLVAMVAEGDLVVQASKLEHPHPSRAGATYTTTRFDMFRIADGRIAEHWDGATKVAAAAAANPPPACPGEDGIAYVCGPTNAEDILRIGATNWLLASGMADERPGGVGGKLHLIDSRDRSWDVLFPGSAPQFAHDTALFPDCPGPLDTANFSAHGLALQNFPAGSTQYRLYMTSHGAREAIEAFVVDASDRPTLTWIGCVPLPETVWANSVVILQDGGFLATKFMDPAAGFAPILAGEANGHVLEWHPGEAVRVVAGTELSGPNGIAVSDDERYLYVAAFGSDTLVRFDRDAQPASSVTVALEVTPDNLRWSEAGTLLTAGSNVENACEDATPCPPGWAVWEIAPDTLTAQRVVGMTGSAGMPAVSTALLVGDEVWVGTPRGDKVGILGK
jgi:predicted SnoaL-like aldol condensation-catalyzing enzyme